MAWRGTAVDVADGDGVACPSCGGHRSGVVETRHHKGVTFRRRKCRCGSAFTTVEVVTDNTMHNIIAKGETYTTVTGND